MNARPCPECGGLVASTIHSCPHCGYVLEQDQQQTQHVGADNPFSSLGWVILALFLFWPLGLVALYYHIKSEESWDRGNRTSAELNGRYARRFAKYSVYAMLVALAIGIFLPVVFLGVLV